MKKQRVIAAIDFGTHGTGYGWTVIEARHQDAKQRRIWLRDQWRSRSTPYPKNLTALLLDNQDEVIAWGHDARKRWAAASAAGNPDQYDYVSSFKMSLASRKGDDGEEIKGGLLSPERSRRLISAYLQRIYQLAFEDIKRSGYSEDEIRWCLTVPAIWNDYQKQLMREAAVAAGLPEDEKRLQLVLEPEAAAYHARVSGVRTVRTSGKRPNLMSRRSRFLVADCGGGTVDLTAYRTDERNRLVEIGREYGGKFGSEYVNQAFLETILAKRFGSHDVVNRITSQVPGALLEVLDAWEAAKLTIGTDNDEDIYLQLPAAIDRLLDDESRTSLGQCQGGITDFIVVKPEEAREVFESVVPAILSLVDKQLEEMRVQRRNAPGRELVILVGGFGNSPYLQERMQEHLAERADVLVPPEPQVAVLKGAVHYTYDPQTKARRAKFTYGCHSTESFKPGIDPKEYQKILPNGRVVCENRFSRFVSAGQTIAVDEVVEHSYLPLWEDQTAVEFELYRTSHRYPRYVTDPGCMQVGEITVDLSEVMHLPLEERGISLEMLFGDTQIGVTAVVKSTGKAVRSRLTFTAME